MIGVASSVSALRNYSFHDTLEFFKSHPQFDSLQIYLDTNTLNKSDELVCYLNNLLKLRKFNIYFHLDFNCKSYMDAETTYIRRCSQVISQLDHEGIIFHFNPDLPLTRYAFIFEFLQSLKGMTPLWIELFFNHGSSYTFQFQLDSYKSLFALYKSRFQLGAVVDIPRIFHSELNLNAESSLRETYGLLGFLKAQNIPLLLHLIDVEDADQKRNHFCTLGQGILPFNKIFNYIREQKIQLRDIILEYEDKIKPLESYDYLKSQNLI